VWSDFFLMRCCVALQGLAGLDLRALRLSLAQFVGISIKKHMVIFIGDYC
jgi:hypothetical protein